MLVQIRPNYRLIALLTFGVTVIVIFYSLYDRTFHRKDQEQSSSRVLIEGRPGWLGGLNQDALDSSSSISGNNVSEGPHQEAEHFYGVMFDAGSTGTRVHVFHFKSVSVGKPPLLISEVFNNTNRGLGEFADSPQGAVAVVRNLLEIAMKSIPKEKWASTPVALKATAGLRLISHAKAEALLDAVHELFKQSPFHVSRSRDQTAVIIDGIHEGEFIWLTVNFLREALGSQDHSNSTIGVLDLGGGSTQITFAPRHRETITEGTPLGLIKPFRFMTESFNLYTHSYLGLGLKEARLGTLKLEQSRKVKDPMATQRHGDQENTFSTVCLPGKVRSDWKFAGTTYATWSSNGPEVTNTYDLCSDVTKAFLSGKVYQPKEIGSGSFCASSYFLGKAVESGLINRELGGTVQVKDYERVAKRACGSFDASNPFLCMDLVFIHTLLTHGYGFTSETKLEMHERIRGFETSWALGATIDLLHSHWDDKHLKLSTTTRRRKRAIRAGF